MTVTEGYDLQLTVRGGFIIFTSEKVWINPERGGGSAESRIFFETSFGPFLESRNRRVGGIKEG